MLISEEIIKVLDAVSEKFGIAIDWTQQNIIPYLQVLSTKIVNYEFYTSIVWMIVFLIPTFIFINMFRHAKKNGFSKTLTRCDDNDWFDPTFFGGMFMTMGIIASLFFIGVLVQVFDIITCLVFTEKTILTFLKSSGLLG